MTLFTALCLLRKLCSYWSRPQWPLLFGQFGFTMMICEILIPIREHSKLGEVYCISFTCGTEHLIVIIVVVLTVTSTENLWSAEIESKIYNIPSISLHAVHISWKNRRLRSLLHSRALASLPGNIPVSPFYLLASTSRRLKYLQYVLLAVACDFSHEFMFLHIPL